MSHYPLLFLLLTSSAFILSSQNKINCDPDNRPSAQTCFGPGASFQPTCGYYSKNCPLEICAQSASNACQACSDPNVLYYKLQNCEPDLVVSECYEGICDAELDPLSEVVFDPVCGLQQGCSDKSDSSCSMTFDNMCKACASSNYKWYQSGVCKTDQKFCNSTKPLSPSSTEPVCAFFDTADGIDQHTTVRNAHTACSDSAVNFYTNGECGGPYANNITYCLPNVRPEACTKEYNPVCGFFKGEDQQIDHKIISNPCTACSDSSIIYYQPGPCEFTCDRSPGLFVECDGITVEPICGKYKDKAGQTKQISLKNACIGCFDIPILIDSYTDGFCPGDVGIRCANDGEGALMGRIAPVCGWFEENCNDSSCRQTFSEPVVACRNDNVVLYVPGLCPGDEGVPCTDYRVNPGPNSAEFVDGLGYSNVCGYREQGCNSSSCRDTFDDSYAACGDESVQYFTQGPCA